MRSQLVLRSATTGHVLRTLGTFGESFTNNGLAVTDDLRSVFYTLAPPRDGSALRIMRLDVATARRRFVAFGSEPSLSPDDRQLAYGAAPHGLSVRSLAGGPTRTVSLTGLLGRSADLTLTSITWLADGDDVVLVAPPQAMAAARRSMVGRTGGSCDPGRRPILVFVHVPPAPAALSAHCVSVPGMDTVAAVLGPSPAESGSVRVASLSSDGFTIRDVAGDGTITKVLADTPGLPLAFDPTGDRLLYVRSHPPALWTSSIGPGRLVGRRRLIARSSLGAAAW